MELQELLNKVDVSTKGGKVLITGSLKVFPPNGKERLSITDTKELKFVEDDGDVQRWHPIWKTVRNFYYVKRIDQPGWKYVGQSNDWLNMCEVSVSIDILDGPGVYFVKGVAYDENDNNVYFSTDTCKFEIE